MILVKDAENETLSQAMGKELIVGLMKMYGSDLKLEWLSSPAMSLAIQNLSVEVSIIVVNGKALENLSSFYPRTFCGVPVVTDWEATKDLILRDPNTKKECLILRDPNTKKEWGRIINIKEPVL